jgi:hypothetical protein
MLRQQFAYRGDIDPLDFLSQVCSNRIEGATLDHRIQAAIALCVYYYPKPSPTRYISKPLALPVVTNASEAAEQIAHIEVLVAKGDITIEDGDALIKNLHSFVAVYSGADLEAIVNKVRTELQDETVSEFRPN